MAGEMDRKRVLQNMARRTSGIVYAKAEGYTLYTDDGRQFIDMINGKGSVILGHNDEDVSNAVRACLDNKGVILSGVSPPMLDVAQMILDDMNNPEMMVDFYSTGTAVVRAATYVARKSSRKEIILSAGYHGWDPMWEFENKFLEPNKGGVVEFFFIPELLEQALDKFKDKVALVIISPDLTYLRNETMEEILELAKSRGVLFCWDDVKQGYRYRQGTSLELVTNKKADLYTFSKGVANGYRISTLVGSRDLMEWAKNLSYTAYDENTPHVAAQATLKKMREKNGYDHLKNIGKKLVGAINDLIKASELPIAIKGDILFQFVFGDRELAKAFYDEGFAQGILLWVGDNQIVSYAYDEALVEELRKRFALIIDKMSSQFASLKGKEITPEVFFRVGWGMLDGASDNLSVEKRIELAREIAKC